MLSLQGGRSDSGVALVIAVLITFAFSTIAIAVANFTEQGFQLAQSSRESAYALYAADTGIECALFADLNENVFFKAVADSYPDDPENVDVNCNGADKAIYYVDSNDADLVIDSCKRLGPGYDWCFKFNMSVNSGSSTRNYRSTVQFGYDSDNDQVKIVGQGYNEGDFNRTQREIVYIYNI